MRATLALAGLLVAVATAATPAATPAFAAATSAKVAGTGVATTGGIPLNMRRAPSSAAERLGTVADGGTVWIVCRVSGDRVAGTVRTTDVWDRLANGAYVADAYVQRGSFVVPTCAGTPTVPAPPVAPGAWQSPVAAATISGFRTVVRPTHDGVDLAAARNAPIRSAAAGTVIRVVCNVSAGTCDVDGNRTLKGCGWYVEVQHAGNVVTRYCHLVRRPPLAVGQRVVKGQLLGHVGSSGSSSGPHLHFEVHQGVPATSANAVSPVTFMRARGVIM